MSAANSPTLALAEHRIAAAERLIERQRKYIEALERRGADSAAARELLSFFRESLEDSQATRARLMGEFA